jgi:hypothetical protein
MHNIFKNKIDIMIRGFGNLGKPELAEEFFCILEELLEKKMPTKLGIDEPIKIPYSREEGIKLWLESERIGKLGGGILIKGPFGFGMIDWNKADNSNDITLLISTKVVGSKLGIERLIKFAKNAFIWLNGVYGYVSHESRPLSSPGMSYTTCLPDITWLNLFGKPYVEMFGVKVIESAPCFVDRFAENSYLLKVSEGPQQVTPEILEKHEQIKKHLGKKAFDRKDPQKSFYTFEEIQAGLHEVNEEGYIAPDFSDYLANQVNINSLEGFAVVKDNGEVSVITKPRKSRKN